MKNIFKISIAVLSIVILFNACKKEGTGGKSIIKGYAKHHSLPIPNCVIYIKYGAVDFPGSNTSKYDASVTANASGYYEFTNLRKGNYYLYGVGYDASIMEAVTGGVGVKIRQNETKNLDVPVTE